MGCPFSFFFGLYAARYTLADHYRKANKRILVEARLPVSRRLEYTNGMTAAKKRNLISVADYLAGELVSPIKHEYLGGVVYAMAGARNAHNLIAANTLGALHGRLRGRRCRAFNSDTKIRVRLPTHVRFYYP